MHVNFVKLNPNQSHNSIWCYYHLIIIINNNNHNDNNYKGNGDNATESIRVVPHDDITKNAGMDVEATPTKSTITTGVGSNNTGVMEQGKRIKL